MEDYKSICEEIHKKIVEDYKNIGIDINESDPVSKKWWCGIICFYVEEYNDIKSYDTENVVRFSKDKLFDVFYNIFKEYVGNWIVIRGLMQGENKKIDRHKVIACLVYSFIRHPVFVVDTANIDSLTCNKKRIDVIKHLNEHILFGLVVALLERTAVDYYKNATTVLNDAVFRPEFFNIKMPDSIYALPDEEHITSYKTHLISMFNLLKKAKESDQSNPTMAVFFILSFSHVVYLIESYSLLCSNNNFTDKSTNFADLSANYGIELLYGETRDELC